MKMISSKGQIYLSTAEMFPCQKVLTLFQRLDSVLRGFAVVLQQRFYRSSRCFKLKYNNMILYLCTGPHRAVFGGALGVRYSGKCNGSLDIVVRKKLNMTKSKHDKMHKIILRFGGTLQPVVDSVSLKNVRLSSRTQCVGGSEDLGL